MHFTFFFSFPFGPIVLLFIKVIYTFGYIAGVRNPKPLIKAEECGIALLQGKGQNVENPWFYTWPFIIIQ